MPLSGEAKTKYQREYMRQRRADTNPKTARESSQELTQARAEIERLRELLADAASQRAAQPSPDQAKELKAARYEIACLQHENAKLKAKIVKPVKVPLDPDSEAARRIDALKKKNKALQAETDKWLMKLKTLVPTGTKTKVAKALTEQTTSPARRIDALQAWNALGLNKIGK